VMCYIEIERLVHEMVCLGKILYAKDDCVAQRAFFHDNGIIGIFQIFVHHFRIYRKHY
jgi:hypothetical protein